jgi:hypothetical protein
VNRYLLTMTACVDPSQGQYRLKRSDPSIRLQDYKTALRYWLNLPDKRVQDILFIENSNYPLDSLKEIAEQENPLKKHVEFISLDCNWYPQGGHYGYAELRMLDLGLQQSKLRNSTTHMIKVSGRFKFPALSKLLDRLPDEFDAVADTRAWQTLRRRHVRPNVTTQIILFSHDLYKTHLQECYHELVPGGPIAHMEGIYYVKLAELAKTYKVIFRFPCNVSPVGFPAHREKSYTHPKQIMTDGIRAVARRVLPNWWI